MKKTKQNTFSLRCPISHKPSFMVSSPIFLRCDTCGTVVVVQETSPQDSSRTVSCCGSSMKPIPFCVDSENSIDHEIDYVVFGGLEHNAIRVKIGKGIHPMTSDHCIEWVYLHSFQGGQFKKLSLNRRSYATFAFADEDAYVYCDRDICKMGREFCQFECKRGLVVFAYCSQHGLFAKELIGINRTKTTS